MSKYNYWQKFEENVHYHIYNRGINGTKLFRKQENYSFFLRKWQVLIHPFCETLGYCLMSNHFHFLVKVKPLTIEIQDKISKMETSKSKKLIALKISYNDFIEDQFKRLFTSHALSINKQENRTGSLFQKRFKRVAIINRFKLMERLAYIHHNPIHHKYTLEYDIWKYSSYSTFVENQTTMINIEYILNLFDNDEVKAIEAFIKYHEKYQKASLLNL